MSMNCTSGDYLSGLRVAAFLWTHRYYPFLFPAVFALAIIAHGALAMLAIIGQGGRIADWWILPRTEHMLPGFVVGAGSENHWIVALFPIVCWLGLMAIGAVSTPRIRGPALARALASGMFLVPAAAISGSVAFAWFGSAYFLDDTLAPHPVVTIAMTAVGLAAAGVFGFRLFRRVWGPTLSGLEFGAAWAILVGLPWFSLGTRGIARVLRASLLALDW